MTLDRGLVQFEELARKKLATGMQTIPGEEAYELYATYGFPQDLVELMARERGLAVDEEGWTRAREAHREASRSEGTFRQLLSAEEVEGLAATRSTYHEDGARAGVVDTEVLGLFDGGGRGDALVLAESPFYPEAGGQVGDAGRIEAADGTFRFRVEDTQRMGEVVVHVGRAEGTAPAGTAVRATVDEERRDLVRKNHTATHLLHAALRAVLGEHVSQQGSYVGPDRLRFDFAHPRGVTPEEIDRIEELVNRHVARNATVGTTVEDLEAAKARGVVALFGEKYDERVRVVDVPGFSTELCGGTHVRAAGDIGAVAITSEAAIQAGVRRIEAVAGPAAVRWMQEQRGLLRQAGELLKVGAQDVPERVAQLQRQVKEAKKARAKSSQADIGAALQAVRAELAEAAGVLHGTSALELDQKALRDLATRVKSLSPDLAVVLFGRDGDKVPWIAICQGRAQEAGVSTGTLVPHLKEHLGGGGGGKPDLAQGQGQNAGGVAEARSAVGEALAAGLAG